jgi:hypothetical protein
MRPELLQSIADLVPALPLAHHMVAKELGNLALLVPPVCVTVL